jgi:hypothetical protein
MVAIIVAEKIGEGRSVKDFVTVAKASLMPEACDIVCQGW